jgi:hypothetical protein
MAGELKHAARDQHRVAYAADCSHCAEAEVVTSRHAGVHLGLSVQVQHRPCTCVEQRIVFECNHSGHCRIQCAGAQL